MKVRDYRIDSFETPSCHSGPFGLWIQLIVSPLASYLRTALLVVFKLLTLILGHPRLQSVIYIFANN